MPRARCKHGGIRTIQREKASIRRSTSEFALHMALCLVINHGERLNAKSMGRHGVGEFIASMVFCCLFQVPSIAIKYNYFGSRLIPRFMRPSVT